MNPWVAVILAVPEPGSERMVSRLPTFLHPAAGRPLIWHAVSALVGAESAPESVIVLAPPDLALDAFEAFPLEVRVLPFDPEHDTHPPPLDTSDRVLLLRATTRLGDECLENLLASDGGWIDDGEGGALAALVNADLAAELLLLRSPLSTMRGLLAESARLSPSAGTFDVRTRADLARAHRMIRDSLVASLMEAGVTFLLPETVIIDVDVRIGRDSIVYPGVTIEGQSTIGEETVIGPGSRIIDSWVGSGVELKGWNYIAHTSVRNRAILEPYVRRGFD